MVTIVSDIKDLCNEASKEIDNMGEKEHQIYYKEHVLLINRAEVLAAILDRSPTKLQSYIAHMLADTQSAKSSPDKTTKLRFVPGPPSEKLAETLTITQLLQLIQDWDPANATELKTLQKELASHKRNIMDIVTSAKGCCNDFSRAKTSAARLESQAAAKKDTMLVKGVLKKVGVKDILESPANPVSAAAAAVPQSRRKLKAATLFELAASFAEPVPQDSFDPKSPFLVSAAQEATAFVQGSISGVLKDFGEQFSTFQKTSPVARAQKKISDVDLAGQTLRTIQADLFGKYLPFGPATEKKMPVPNQEVDKQILTVSLFAVGQNLEFESSDKECAGNIRWVLQGVRSLVLVHGTELIQYMKESEIMAARLSNPHDMQRAYAFLKAMTIDMVREYVSQYKMYHVTTGVGDAIYVPAGMFFAEKVGTTPCLIGVRLGVCVPHEPSIRGFFANLKSLNKDIRLMQQLADYSDEVSQAFDSSVMNQNVDAVTEPGTTGGVAPTQAQAPFVTLKAPDNAGGCAPTAPTQAASVSPSLDEKPAPGVSSTDNDSLKNESSSTASAFVAPAAEGNDNEVTAEEIEDLFGFGHFQGSEGEEQLPPPPDESLPDEKKVELSLVALEASGPSGQEARRTRLTSKRSASLSLEPEVEADLLDGLQNTLDTNADSEESNSKKKTRVDQPDSTEPEGKPRLSSPNFLEAMKKAAAEAKAKAEAEAAAVAEAEAKKKPRRGKK